MTDKTDPWANIERTNCNCHTDADGIYADQWVLPEAAVLAARAADAMAIADLRAERDAMQRRAESAESDWQAAMAGARIEHD